ncbi:MAG: response regulator [Planctomycetes bacterium]|nr:response regulator [Planctomycetota bacterium]
MAEERTVLFVDDEEQVLRSLEMGLLDEPYHKLFAKSGKEALEILQKEQVHIIVTDIRMPGMDGIELLKIVREKYPNIVKIVFTGFMDTSALYTEFNEGEIFKILPKPWNLENLLQETILKAIEHYNLQSERDVVMQKN